MSVHPLPNHPLASPLHPINSIRPNSFQLAPTHRFLIRWRSSRFTNQRVQVFPLSPFFLCAVSCLSNDRGRSISHRGEGWFQTLLHISIYQVTAEKQSLCVDLVPVFNFSLGNEQDLLFHPQSLSSEDSIMLATLNAEQMFFFPATFYHTVKVHFRKCEIKWTYYINLIIHSIFPSGDWKLQSCRQKVQCPFRVRGEIL